MDAPIAQSCRSGYVYRKPFVKAICATTPPPTAGFRAETLFRRHFLEERRAHLAALEKGYAPPVSLVHFWSARPGGNLRPPTWILDTLLISGYDIFHMLKNRGFNKAAKSLLPPQREEIDLAPAASQDLCLWAAYQKLPPEVRVDFNAAAYALTADRCRAVKGVILDPPKRVEDPALLAVLSAFTAADTAQLIIDFAVDPYLPNHLRCCASTSRNRRCGHPRVRRYCPILVGCCNGFQIEPNACLYDVCSFHLLKINQKQNYVLVSCD